MSNTKENRNNRVFDGALERLEPYEGKLSRTVLRGRGDGNVALPLDDKSAPIALEQIKNRHYFERYLNDKRAITLIGINFSSKEKNIVDVIVEPCLKRGN